MGLANKKYPEFACGIDVLTRLIFAVFEASLQTQFYILHAYAIVERQSLPMTATSIKCQLKLIDRRFLTECALLAGNFFHGFS